MARVSGGTTVECEVIQASEPVLLVMDGGLTTELVEVSKGMVSAIVPTDEEFGRVASISRIGASSGGGVTS